MNTLFILSVIFCTVAAMAKGIVHIMLDLRNGYKIEFARSRGYIYFLPYDKEVSPKDERLKRICNFLQKMLTLSVIIFAIIFLIKTFVKGWK